MKLTFNLVPSLLVQLEAFAEGRARDWHLELGLKPADELTESRARDHPVGVFPRAARADDRSLSALCRAAAEARRGRGIHRTRIFSTCRCGTSSRGSIRSISTTTRACGGSSRSSAASARPTKAELREVELEILRRVIPEYREAAERGQVELSTSPFYHPILPLLCDTDIYLRTHPASARAAPRVPASGRCRGAARAGARMSSAAVRPRAGRAVAVRRVGVGRSGGARRESRLPMDGDRRSHSRTDDRPRVSPRRAWVGSSSPEPLYRPYGVQVGSRQIACLFRDHSLSDLIGFVYAGWQAEAAAADFVQPPGRGGPALFRRRAAGKRPPSRSSSTAKTRGSTSKEAAARSCGRSTACWRRIRSFGRSP